ncbi:MAG: hypothetical protein SGBAC_013444 [Bacillariaceae sp.]
MSIQQRVIQENNLAASMIEEGAYDEASSKLCRLYKAYKNCNENEGGDNDKPSIGLDECMTKGHPMSASVDPDLPFMYSDAIRISFEPAEAEIPEHDVISVILFNLALSYHHSALDSMDPDADLGKALFVYERLYAMQQGHQENFQSNLMFMLSVMNNIGIIHQWRSDDAVANQCFSMLLSALMLISSNKSQPSKDRTHHAAVIHGFHRNVILNIPPCASVA